MKIQHLSVSDSIYELSDEWYIREDVVNDRFHIDYVLVSRFGAFSVLERLDREKVKVHEGSLYIDAKLQDYLVREHLGATKRLEGVLKMKVKPLIVFKQDINGGVVQGVQVLPLHHLRNHIEFFWQKVYTFEEVMAALRILRPMLESKPDRKATEAFSRNLIMGMVSGAASNSPAGAALSF
ncbi:hypothetical protein [Deinococcus roseus]|uniref:Uncharacterized protein n=1 Tax=Deinococcus roseus TaxID=392414 RepID=A0ABQ2D3N8_9DEIO|nr:hypothetical protein [Deinococcus roseus]GGJ41726.1 hypothetical protein GCM10008938_29710 [Deinococcus roseus]